MPSRSPLDLVLTFLGCWILAFVPVTHVTTYAVPAASSEPVADFVAAGIVAAPAAYVYWRRGLSVRKLGELSIRVAALAVIAGLPALVALRLLGFPVSSDPASEFLAGIAVLSLIYAVAIRHV